MSDQIFTQCRSCSSKSEFTTLSVFNHESYDGCPEEYTFAKCGACSEVALFYREDVELMWDVTGELPEFHCLWPIDQHFLHFVLPEEIGESYSEAIQAAKLGLYKSSAVMIGRALEAVCRDYDKNIKSIHTGLAKMLNDGALSQEMHDWANELRLLRNIGAHPSNVKIQEQDVMDAIDFLKSIFELIYYVRPKFNAFKERSERD